MLNWKLSKYWLAGGVAEKQGAEYEIWTDESDWFWIGDSFDCFTLESRKARVGVSQMQGSYAWILRSSKYSSVSLTRSLLTTAWRLCSLWKLTRRIWVWLQRSEKMKCTIVPKPKRFHSSNGIDGWSRRWAKKSRVANQTLPPNSHHKKSM